MTQIRNWFQRLSVRLSFMSAVLIIVAMITFTYFVVEQESQTLSLELRKQAVALSDNLAASTASYIIVKDYTSLESILTRAAQFPSILDIQVSNDDGQLLGEVQRDSSGEVQVLYDNPADKPPGMVERQIFVSGDMITVWQPVILGDLVGWIRTRYTLERIAEVKAQIWLHNSTIGVIVVLITIVIFSLYLRKPVHMIEQSTEFADELDENAGRQIKVNQQYYELTRLASALNRTSRNLQAKNEALNQKIREQQELTDELELRVLDRTSELSIARDEAINANRSKSEFLANMSHEIRTPLTAVIGFAESLLDSSHTMEERVDSINRIIRAGKHLLRIINEILDVSKIEANKLEVECIPFPLVDVFRDVYSFVRLPATEKGLEFRVSCEFPMPAVIRSDPVRLKQILINLCNNAVKFTRQGSVTIKASCDVEGQQLIVKVIDTGIGLSQLQLSKLFMPFTQADASTTRNYGGTGLGLHLSKQLAEKLGGTLTVESVPEIGSCFTLSISTGALAQVEMVYQCPDFEHLETVKETDNKQVYLSGRVLLVEDNLDNQRLVAILLKRIGVDLAVANNGKEAISILQVEQFDVVLMDVQMPVMDGLTATKLLRKQGYAGPIIALTANALKQEQQECVDAGYDDICTKPIDHVEFNRVLSKYLNYAKPTQESGPPIVSTLLAEEPEFAELVGEFVKKLPAMIQEIHTAFNEKLMDKLRHEVHTLKGTSGNFGYPEVFELTKRIEFEIVAGNDSGVADLLAKLDGLTARVEQGMNADMDERRMLNAFPAKG